MRCLFLLLLLLMTAGCGSGSGGGNDGVGGSTDRGPDILAPDLCSSGDDYTVVNVIDGDTIDILLPNGSTDQVRYIGINTPEVGQRCASEATVFNRSLVDNKLIHLVLDVSSRDIYGRLLSYVCVEDIFVNAQLVSSGYAEAVAYPPDTAYANYFEELESNAITAGRGCLNSPSSSCCKICRNSKACGDSCINKNYTCTKPPGCACNG